MDEHVVSDYVYIYMYIYNYIYDYVYMTWGYHWDSDSSTCGIIN